MIRVCIKSESGRLTGFEVSGHSMRSSHGQDIVCAAVSSACYLVANTVTEVMGLTARIGVDDGFMQMYLDAAGIEPAQEILRGFLLHMNEIASEYPENVKVILSEV